MNMLEIWRPIYIRKTEKKNNDTNILDLDNKTRGVVLAEVRFNQKSEET